MGQTQHWLCAHTLVNRFLAERARRGEFLHQDSLLFPIVSADGTQVAPLTYENFTANLALDLEAAGFPSKDYKGHSFRIGCATSLALNGVPEMLIEDAGGWSRRGGGVGGD